LPPVRIRTALQRLSKLSLLHRTRGAVTSFVTQFRRSDVQNVIAAYETMLGRPPESDDVVATYTRIGIAETLRRIADSPEFKIRHGTSPFFHYNASFDVRATIGRHAAPDLVSHPDFLTNFLGVRIEPRFLPVILDGRAGEVEGIPVPANWHADMAEWGAALRAVDLAHETFAMAELGCGWGCWMNNTGVAARAAGLTVDLIGVEGNAAQLAYAREACKLNGFDSTEVTFHNGIAAGASGTALFPRKAPAGGEWGMEPVFGADEPQRAKAIAAGSHDELPMISLQELLGDRTRLDLLHVDIQGGEADLVESCRSALDEHVSYLVIGTHSREIEGRLFASLLGSRWRLEIERPAIFTLAGELPMTTVDGVQGWRNLGLMPE
jgi:FkbM family methyltransferase